MPDPDDPENCIKRPGGNGNGNGNGNGSERGKRREQDNAGDTAQKGEPVGLTPDDTTNPSDTHDCKPGFRWDANANDGLGGCVPDTTDQAGSGSGGEAPSTPGKEALTRAQFGQYMQKTIEYFEKMSSLRDEYYRRQEAKLVSKLETITAKPIMVGPHKVEMRAEHMAYGLVKKESVEKSSQVNDKAFKAVYESTVAGPAKYFENAAKYESTEVENLPGSIRWKVNIEAFLDSLEKRNQAWGTTRGVRSRDEMQSSMTEAITISAGDMPQIFAKQIYVIPGGRMRVPIRQFLDVQIIENADRYHWYKINSFDLDDTTAEGSEPTNEAQTVTKVTATPTLKRGVQTVNFSDIENAPFDLIEAFNRAAALGSISEEAKEVLDTTYNAITPTNWVNGNTGAAITDDDVASMTLKQEGIYAALDLIERQGGDTSPGNAVAFLHPKAVRELILDTAADFFTGQQPLSHRALGVLENRLGIDIVPTNKVHAQDNTTNDTYRNVVMIKGVIGLAVAADLQLEAQRRPELSAVKVAARHRLKAAVIDETMTCRVSSAQ